MLPKYFKLINLLSNASQKCHWCPHKDDTLIPDASAGQMPFISIQAANILNEWHSNQYTSEISS